jgi:hypothetical protein
MSTIDYIILEKLKKKCNTQEEELERFFESLHDAIQNNKPIPKCVDWNYVKVLNYLFTFNTNWYFKTCQINMLLYTYFFCKKGLKDFVGLICWDFSCWSKSNIDYQS